jgi:hypothetical protein
MPAAAVRGLTPQAPLYKERQRGAGGIPSIDLAERSTIARWR